MWTISYELRCHLLAAAWERLSWRFIEKPSLALKNAPLPKFGFNRTKVAQASSEG